MPETTTITTTGEADAGLGQSKYDFTSRSFPSNLGNDYLGHWMVININVQDASNFGNVQYKGVPSSLNYNRLEGELSKTDALRYGIDQSYTYTKMGPDSGSLLAGLDRTPFNKKGNFGPTQGQWDGGVANFDVSLKNRMTTRIKESIALYMPNSELTFSDAHDFDNISLTKFGAAAVGGIAAFLAATTFSGIVGPALGATGAREIGRVLNSLGAGAGSALQVSGTPINPKVEVLFSNTFQREFGFDFIFSPESEQESKDIMNIIRTLRFHAAPELQPGVINSFFWIPPSEFDITFFYRDENGHVQENTNIPRINTCVLKQIDVSYAPTGAYSTFTNGHPVQIRMMLRFIETEVVHKLRVTQGF